MKKKCAVVLSATMVISSFSAISSANYGSKIVGKDRIETSCLTARLSENPSFKNYNNYKGNYVFANSKSFADALSAYNLVFDKNARLMLINEKTNLDKYITNGKNAYIVGGVNTISRNLEKKIKKRFKSVKRYDGQNRYHTNNLILDDCNFKKLGIADGRNYPDALAASGYLKAKGYGLKLVDGAKTYTLSSKYQAMCTFGGVNSVKYVMGNRISGSDRYETAQNINSMFKPKAAALVYGQDFPDALSALNVIFSNYQRPEKKATAVVLSNGKLPSSERAYLNAVSEVFIIGGKIGNDISLKSANEKEHEKEHEERKLYESKKIYKNKKILKDLNSKKNKIEEEIARLKENPSRKLVSQAKQIKLIKKFLNQRAVIENGKNFSAINKEIAENPKMNFVYSNNKLLKEVNDTLTYNNILRSLEMIKEGNRKRATENKPSLKVSEELMIYSSFSTATYEVAKKYEHTFFINHIMALASQKEFPKGISENLAWRYENPFDGWWDEEKEEFLRGGSDRSEVGHYLNLRKDTINVTGFSTNKNKTYEQMFSRVEDLNKFLTPDEFIDEINKISDLWEDSNANKIFNLEKELEKVNSDIKNLKNK